VIDALLIPVSSDLPEVGLQRQLQQFMAGEEWRHGIRFRSLCGELGKRHCPLSQDRQRK
jgi:hypothetical protein